MKVNTALVFLSLQLMVVSCKKDEKQPVQNQTNIPTDSVKTTAKTEDEIDFKNFHIFNVSTMNRNDLMDTFISVSDVYNDPQSVPADILKKQKELPFGKLSYLELDEQYKQKMLTGIHLTENDSLYLYNYGSNKLHKLPISKLKAVAYLSPYITEGEEIDAGSYMLGFQIDSQKSNEIFDKYSNVIAYFGNKNPFVENKMKMIKWEKAGTDVQKKYFSGSKLRYGGTFQAKYDNMTYYIQDLLEEYGTQERKLVVINNHDEKIFEKTFSMDDGVEFNPLEKIEDDGSNYYAQWTGHLFKGKAPVVFGFTSPSFGCPVITFIDKEKTELSINCDNRH